MFTGIIKAVGTVERIDAARADKRIFISFPESFTVPDIGASVACSGCCLTVADREGNWFAADVSAETLSKTVIGSWGEGTKINLEASLRAGEEIGGHLVSGHVDGLAVVDSITPEGGSHRLKIRAPAALARFIAPKGSVALDGISLTVNEVDGAEFGVNIIPHTWLHTTLGGKKAGDSLNLEIDMLARYVARLLGKDAA